MPIGNWSTVNIPTDLARKSYSAAMMRYMPNGGCTLFGLTALLGEETAYQIEHGFYSKTMVFPSVTLNAAVADGVATTFTVLDSSSITVGMVLRADTTGENVLVTAVPNGTSLTVRRALGGTSAAIGNTVKLWQVGNAYEEGSLRPAAVSIVPVRQINYTQIFRNTWAVTGTSEATDVIAGGTLVAENKQDCAAFHATAIETALIFGKKYMGTLNGMPFHTMGGLIEAISTNAPGNIATLLATTNYTQLEAALDPQFDQTTDPKGTRERLKLVGGTALRVLNSIARVNSQYEISTGEKEWGLQFSSFKLPRGRFNMIEHPLFNAYGGSSSWSKMALDVDVNTFQAAYLRGRKTKFKDFGQGSNAADNGIDAIGGTVTTEMTCLVRNPAANAVQYNYTAAAVG
jgi:Family of unknown function (DUF5309)